MRIAAPLIAALALTALAPSAWIPSASAQETIVMEGDAGSELSMAEPGACNCRASQAPPWHGGVTGDHCAPSCPPPTMFHANPCGQLWMKHTARQQGHVLPPCFPRMHGRLADGWWPTPRPITLPRCPNCGAHIDAGM